MCRIKYRDVQAGIKYNDVKAAIKYMDVQADIKIQCPVYLVRYHFLLQVIQSIEWCYC